MHNLSADEQCACHHAMHEHITDLVACLRDYGSVFFLDYEGVDDNRAQWWREMATTRASLCQSLVRMSRLLEEQRLYRGVCARGCKCLANADGSHWIF